MQINYTLDKDKFTKVYNELKINNDGTIMDNFKLLDKHNVTKDKTLRNIMFAINNNLSFNITNIEEINKVEDMYSHYDNPNRLTKDGIVDCIKEIDHISLGLRVNGSFIEDIRLLKTPNSIDVFVLINTRGGNMAIVKPVEKLSEIVELVQQKHNKTQRQLVVHHNPDSQGFLATIKQWFS